MIDTAEQIFIDSLANCTSDHNKAFVCQAIQIVLRDLVESILENETGIRETFEAGVCQVLGTSSFAKEAAKVLVSKPVIIAPIGAYVVKMTGRAAGQASKPEVLAVPFSSSSSRSDSSSSKSKKDRSRPSRKTSRKTLRSCKSSRAFPDTETWSSGQSSKGSDVSRRRDDGAHEAYVSKLPVMRVVNSHFLYVANY